LNKGNKLYEISGRIIVYAYAGFLLIPMYFIVMAALKTGADITVNPLGFPSKIMFSNFSEAFVKGNLARCGLNSIIVTVSSVTLNILSAIIVTFGLHKLSNRRVGTILYGLIIATMMVPGVGWVAYIIMMQKLHLYNSLLGLILPSAFGLPFNVFILLGFMRGIPKDFEDAATIDGCTDFQDLFYIIVPLVKPALTALGIFAFVGSWNNMFGPLLIIRDKNLYTLPLGILAFKGSYSVKYNLLFAAVFIATAPLVVLYLRFQDNFIEALSGGIKG